MSSVTGEQFFWWICDLWRLKLNRWGSTSQSVRLDWEVESFHHRYKTVSRLVSDNFCTDTCLVCLSVLQDGKVFAIRVSAALANTDFRLHESWWSTESLLWIQTGYSILKTDHFTSKPGRNSGKGWDTVKGKFRFSFNVQENTRMWWWKLSMVTSIFDPFRWVSTPTLPDKTILQNRCHHKS